MPQRSEEKSLATKYAWPLARLITASLATPPSKVGSPPDGGTEERIFIIPAGMRQSGSQLSTQLCSSLTWRTWRLERAKRASGEHSLLPPHPRRRARKDLYRQERQGEDAKVTKGRTRRDLLFALRGEPPSKGGSPPQRSNPLMTARLSLFRVTSYAIRITIHETQRLTADLPSSSSLITHY